MRKQLFTLYCCCLLSWQLTAQLSFEQTASLPSDLVHEKPSVIKKAESNNILGFELVGGLIIVDAQTDGETKSFILDTGAPTLILNQKVDKPKSFAVGLAGTSSAANVDVSYFRLGSITNPKMKPFATDISHLERLKSTKIDGLIGYQVLKSSNILLDYQSKTVGILPAGEKHQLKENQEEIMAIPFKTRGHIPVIEIQLGKKKLRMGIDTGSEGNVLDLRFKRKFRKYFQGEPIKRYVRGIDQATVGVYSARIGGLKINSYDLKEMNYLFTDMTYLNQGFGKRIDGILGYPFLQPYIVSIDFGAKMIYIAKSKLENDLQFNESSLVDGK